MFCKSTLTVTHVEQPDCHPFGKTRCLPCVCLGRVLRQNQNVAWLSLSCVTQHRINLCLQNALIAAGETKTIPIRLWPWHWPCAQGSLRRVSFCNAPKERKSFAVTTSAGTAPFWKVQRWCFATGTYLFSETKRECMAISFLNFVKPQRRSRLGGLKIFTQPWPCK